MLSRILSVANVILKISLRLLIFLTESLGNRCGRISTEGKI